MQRSGTAFWGCSLCALLLLFSGCSSNKRLGESRIEARRYSKGWHVNASSSSRGLKLHAVVPSDQPAVPQCRGVWAEEGRDVWASAEDFVIPEDQNMSPPPGSSVLEEGVDDGHGFFIEERIPHASLPSFPFPDESGGVSNPFDGSESETTGLPEPVAGRHPDAVLGFVMSLGWLFGLIASSALDLLNAANPGSAAAIGLLLSLGGYFLSRSAYRASKANPERYPRSGLASSARWVAGFPVLLGFIYLVVVVIVYVLILGLLLGSW